MGNATASNEIKSTDKSVFGSQEFDFTFLRQMGTLTIIIKQAQHRTTSSLKNDKSAIGLDKPLEVSVNRIVADRIIGKSVKTIVSMVTVNGRGTNYTFLTAAGGAEQKGEIITINYDKPNMVEYFKEHDPHMWDVFIVVGTTKADDKGNISIDAEKIIPRK